MGILIALLELRIRNPKVLRTQIRRWSITPAIDVLMVLHAAPPPTERCTDRELTPREIMARIRAQSGLLAMGVKLERLADGVGRARDRRHRQGGGVVSHDPPQAGKAHEGPPIAATVAMAIAARRPPRNLAMAITSPVMARARE